MKFFLTQIVLLYIRFFAKLQLKKINPQIIGVGGSSGKTSTAWFISLILSKKYEVKHSKGKNSETGIPLNILNLDLKEAGLRDWLRVLIMAPMRVITDYKKYDVYVVEMGIDSPKKPKNMEYLLGIVKPHMGVITNISVEHSFNFDPFVDSKDFTKRKEEILSLIAREEGQLLKSINESGISVVNLDDSLISDLLPLKSKIVTVSAKVPSADFYISSIKISKEQFEVNFTFLKDDYRITVPRPLPKYFAYSFVLSIAAAFSFGISVQDSIDLLISGFELPPGRFSIFKGIKNTTIIDSSYNSSLEAAVGALEVIPQISENRRKVGVLGDMRELGSLSKIQHELMAREIPKNLDFVILIGPMTKSYVAPVLEKSGFEYKSFESYKEAKTQIEGLIKKNDVVLVKGSQNTLFLERVVEMLLLDSKDSDKLCRRGKFWDVKRKQS